MNERDGRVAGRTALVTGGAQGLGEAIARRLTGEGARVLIADRQDDAGRALADELEGAMYLTLDVTCEDDWEHAIHRTEADGGIDVLVNNAGIFDAGSITELPLVTYRRVIDVNQIGVFLGLKHAGRAMAARGSGSIVNISSTAGLRAGTPGLAAYCASKWAVRAMTKTAAVELAASGVRVNSVHPGATETPMMRESMGIVPEQLARVLESIPLGRVGEPRDVAQAVLFLASDESSYMTGAELAVDGGSIL